MYCHVCGTKAYQSAQHCHSCGTSLSFPISNPSSAVSSGHAGTGVVMLQARGREAVFMAATIAVCLALALGSVISWLNLRPLEWPLGLLLTLSRVFLFLVGTNVLVRAAWAFLTSDLRVSTTSLIRRSGFIVLRDQVVLDHSQWVSIRLEPSFWDFGWLFGFASVAVRDSGGAEYRTPVVASAEAFCRQANQLKAGTSHTLFAPLPAHRARLLASGLALLVLAYFIGYGSGYEAGQHKPSPAPTAPTEDPFAGFDIS